MRIAVLYYSGDKWATKAIADILKEGCGAKIEGIQMKRPLAKKGTWKFIRGVALSFFKLNTPIKSLAFSPENADLIFIGTPVWAGSASAPIRTLLSQYDFSGKKIALFATCGGDSGQVFNDMKRYLDGASLCGTKVWSNPLDISADDLCRQVEKWSELIIEQSASGCDILRLRSEK